LEAANLRPAHTIFRKKTKLHASSFTISGLCFWRQLALVARIPKAEKPLGACFLIPLRALNCPQVSTHHKHQSIHYLANLMFFSPKQFRINIEVVIGRHPSNSAAKLSIYVPTIFHCRTI